MDIAKLLAVAADLKPVIEGYKTANADGKISIEEGLGLVVTALAILDKHGVTIAELAELAKGLAPLLPLLKGLAK